MKRFLLILSLVLVIASCEEDQNFRPAVEGPELTVALGSAVYTDASGTAEAIPLQSAGDIGLYEFDNKVSIFTNSNRKFTPDANNNFTGAAQSSEGWSENGRTVYAYMPYNMYTNSVRSCDFEIPVTFTQDVENPDSHLSEGTFMVSTSDVNNGAKISTLDFTPQTCLLRWTFTNNTNGEFTVDKLKYSNSSGNIPTKATYNFRESALSVSGAASAMQVSLSSPVTLAVGESLTISLPMCPMTASVGSTITTEVSTDRGPLVFDETLKEERTFEAGKYYAVAENVTERTYFRPVVVNLPEKQNSFIAVPSNNPEIETFLMIPVTRVNEFWSGVDATSTIEDDTKWVAEIIWKDFDFENKVLYMEDEGKSGTGTIDRIKVILKKSAADQWGNAVVGVKKADAQGNPTGDYLWSWHIWVSDVTTETAVSVNASQPGALLMDRHLGAKSANKEDGVLAQGLLYQWGRKDPFIGTSAISYADGVKPSAAQTNYTWPAPIDFVTSFGQVNNSKNPLAYAVSHPTTFIMRSDVSWAWLNWQQASTSDFTYKLWMATADSGTAEKKTIYDPCPKGWRMPIQAAYGDGTANISDNVPTNANMTGWVWNDTYRGYEVNNIWFPAQIGLNGRTGGYGADATTGSDDITNAEAYEDPTQKAFVVWTGQGSSLTISGTARSLSRHLYFTKDVIQPQLRGSGRANANPVRCMRYTAEDE